MNLDDMRMYCETRLFSPCKMVRLSGLTLISQVSMIAISPRPSIQWRKEIDSALNCRQDDVGNHKRRLVDVERSVHFIDGFLDLQYKCTVQCIPQQNKNTPFRYYMEARWQKRTA